MFFNNMKLPTNKEVGSSICRTKAGGVVPARRHGVKKLCITSTSPGVEDQTRCFRIR